MKKIADYKTEDFLTDPAFREWVRQGADPDGFWSRSLANHPEQARHARQARELLLAGAVAETPVPDSRVDAIIRNTMQAVQAVRPRETSVIRLNSRRLGWYAAAAASVVLLLSLGWYTSRLTTGQSTPVARVTPQTGASVIEKRNNSRQVMPVNLPDGSTVLLQPDSRLSYSVAFTGRTRDVRLTGQAFFDVVKNPAHPFFVYAGDVVTRVVGTSFTVRAFPGDGGVRVLVRTGQVAVYQRTPGSAQVPPSEKPILLKPTEQAMLDPTTRQLTRVSDDVKRLAQTAPRLSPAYEFDEANVADVFARLETAYGVPIRFDRNLLAQCSLTTTLADEPLTEKLKIICAGIGPNTRFTFDDTEVVIHSKGCNQ